MLTGVILAGGQNRRMNGKVKALLPFRGEMLVQRQIRRMKPVCNDIILVTNQPHLFTNVVSRFVRVITDDIPGKGPLSGMHAAFSHAKNEHIWVVGCDMPFVSAQAAHVFQEHKKAAGCDAVVPVVGSKIHPLHAVYSRKCAQAIGEALDGGDYRVMSLLRKIDWEEAGEALLRTRGLDLRFTLNVNTPEEYDKALIIGQQD